VAQVTYLINLQLYKVHIIWFLYSGRYCAFLQQLLCRGGHTDLAEFRTVQNGGKAGRVSPWTRRRRRALRAKTHGEFLEQRAPHNSSFLSSTQTETTYYFMQ
jgi:hypothetical protein